MDYPYIVQCQTQMISIEQNCIWIILHHQNCILSPTASSSPGSPASPGPPVPLCPECRNDIYDWGIVQTTISFLGKAPAIIPRMIMQFLITQENMGECGRMWETSQFQEICPVLSQFSRRTRRAPESMCTFANDLCRITLHTNYPCVEWDHIQSISKQNSTAYRLSLCRITPPTDHPCVEQHCIWVISVQNSIVQKLSLCRIALHKCYCVE